MEGYLGEHRVFKKFLFQPRYLPVGSEKGKEEWRWLSYEYIRCVYDPVIVGMFPSDPWLELFFVE